VWSGKKEQSISDINCFRRASIRLYNYWKENQKKISWDELNGEGMYPKLCVHYVFKSIEEDIKQKKYLVSPAWFASSNTYAIRLPKYFRNRNMLFK